jgi:hypothetical protein
MNTSTIDIPQIGHGGAVDAGGKIKLDSSGF